MKFILQLEEGVWLATGDGDPSRTCNIENAMILDSPKEIRDALDEARKYRHFLYAEMIPVS